MYRPPIRVPHSSSSSGSVEVVARAGDRDERERWAFVVEAHRYSSVAEDRLALDRVGAGHQHDHVFAGRPGASIEVDPHRRQVRAAVLAGDRQLAGSGRGCGHEVLPPSFGGLFVCHAPSIASTPAWGAPNSPRRGGCRRCRTGRWGVVRAGGWLAETGLSELGRRDRRWDVGACGWLPPFGAVDGGPGVPDGSVGSGPGGDPVGGHREFPVAFVDQVVVALAQWQAVARSCGAGGRIVLWSGRAGGAGQAIPAWRSLRRLWAVQMSRHSL